MEKIESHIISALREIISDNFVELKNSRDITVYLDTPKNKEFGDLSTNIAMQLAKKLGKSPIEVANIILGSLKKDINRLPLKEFLASVKIEGPGFINFYLIEKSLYDDIKEVLKKGDSFGRSDIGQDKKLQIEFVSANPTGPLSIAHARQAAVGDTLANILSFIGWQVSREYYINDEGNQIRLLGESIRARYLELLKKEFSFPENGYKGTYIYDIANILIDEYSDNVLNKETDFFSNYGTKFILNWIKDDLNIFGVKFDNWFSQKELSATKKIEESISEIKKRGLIYEKEGAVWFRSTDFGDDKDRVLIKSDGTLTYITPDIAYHRDKFLRGFIRLINIWGPDHHGYISRLKAAVTALGFEDESVNILIVQLVTLYKDKVLVPMSTREGRFITLKELISETGKDAARYFFLMRKIDSHLDFDMELAKKHTAENPVFYVQYAHARISGIIKKAGIKTPSLMDSNLALLTQAQEIELVKLTVRFPEIVKQAGSSLEPYRLIPYLENLAKAFHSFYDKHRVICPDTELTHARLALIEAVRIVIKNGLTLTGVSAPEEM
jgi:arginyl-tRNA synthetase